MKYKIYRGFDDWYELYEKYEHADFDDNLERKAFREEFETISMSMWHHYINLASNDIEKQQELAETLAEMWCSGIGCDSIKGAYEDALDYLRYASDRMNINRWMRIRILLNYDIE